MKMLETSDWHTKFSYSVVFYIHVVKYKFKGEFKEKLCPFNVFFYQNILKYDRNVLVLFRRFILLKE